MLGNLLVTGLGRFGGMLIQLIVTVILSRFLSPVDFGIVAMCSIFLSISEMLVDSGLGGSIIYFKDVKEVELHTVFWTNIAVSFLIYIILYIFSGNIAAFYNTPILEDIIKIIGLSIIIHSFTIIQYTLLSKELKFRVQTKIMILSSLLSSVIVLFIAYKGYGLWALVAQPISLKLCQTFFYSTMGIYQPRFQYSYVALKKHWSFGSKLLLSSFFKVIYDNIYIQVIGRFASLKEAGFYSQAKRFNDIPTNLLMFPLDKVIFPSLLKTNEPIHSMKSINKWFAIFVVPSLLLGSLISKELVLIALGNQWAESGWMLSLMLIGTIGASFEVLNRCFLKATGKVNILIRYDLIKRIVNLIVILICSFWSIFGLLIAFIINGIIGWIYNGMALKRAINFNLKSQFLPVLLIFVISLIPYLAVNLSLSFFDLGFWECVFFKVFFYVIIFLPLMFLFCREETKILFNKMALFIRRK